MKCIAIDDEPLALSLIKGYFKHHTTIELETFTNPILGIEAIKKEKPELVMLDIEMKEYSGLELARELPEECLLIFSTAHASYALDGYDLKAVDFLHKPFTYERFASAIAHIEQIVEIHNRAAKFESSDEGAITIKVDYQNVTIAYADIIYIEALANYVKIHCVNNCKRLTKMSIKGFMELLPPSDFLRLHRSYAVAKSQVASFTKQYVKLSDPNNTTIPVGRNYADEVYKMLISSMNCG
ncbi:MAG: LytTR family DNA-binding domain-containing protein [bacterium]